MVYGSLHSPAVPSGAITRTLPEYLPTGTFLKVNLFDFVTTLPKPSIRSSYVQFRIDDLFHSTVTEYCLTCAASPSMLSGSIGAAPESAGSLMENRRSSAWSCSMTVELSFQYEVISKPLISCSWISFHMSPEIS